MPLVSILSYCLQCLQQYSHNKMAGCKIQYIGNDMQFGIPLLIILGLIFSIWSVTFFIKGLYALLSWCLDDVTYILVVVTSVIIIVLKEFALFYGVKKNIPKLVRSWYIVKIVECILISLGIVISAFDMFMWHPKYDCLIGLPLFPFGVYLIACVKKIYKNMTSPASIYQQVLIQRADVLKV